MPLESIYLNCPPVVAVNCDNQRAMGKEKQHKVKFENSTKNDSIEFIEQKTKKKHQQQKKTIKTNKPANKKKDKMEIKF